MARPRVFNEAEFIGCVVDGQTAREMRRIATRDNIKVSVLIRRALDAEIAADMVAQLTQLSERSAA